MATLIYSVHIILCILLIIMVLLQQGKGADAGAAFGGGSNTLFGATGATSLIVKITTGLAMAFMATSVLLILQYQSGAFNSEPSAAVGSPFREKADVAPSEATTAQTAEVAPEAKAAEAPAVTSTSGSAVDASAGALANAPAEKSKEEQPVKK